MRLIVDTHLHFYPCYNLPLALDNLRKNLTELESKAVCIGILAEPIGHNFFINLKENPPKSITNKLEVQSLKNGLLLREEGFNDLFLLPGRQIITKENIEILCLLADIKIENGLPAQKIIDIIRKNNGVPVISWAPGKWFFKRGKVVKELIQLNDPGSLLLGDTSLRPKCWALPQHMKKALRKGILVISGSDPLPFPGEEKVMGQYGICFNCDFDVNNPTNSIRDFLLQSNSKPILVGKRGNSFQTLERLFKHAKTKKL